MTPATDSAAPIQTDALVIGAGPVGLFQVFQLGLLGIGCHVVDSLPYPGGQCIELYPDKPIYDIPGLAVCTGRELTDRLLAQIAPFAVPLHLGQEVHAVASMDCGRFRVETSRGIRFIAKTVFIAGGVGAFQPRRLKLDGIDRFEGRQLHYCMDDAAAWAGQRVVVLGGDDAALDAAVALVAHGTAASVAVLHRRDVFQATAERISAAQALRDTGSLRVVVGQASGFDAGDDGLGALRVTGSDGAVSTLPLDQLLVCSGLSPRLGPIAEWGLALQRKQLVVDTATFSTSVPGIFAVGDINTYPGKKKLIVCGFHECALAAYGAAPIVFPDEPVQLQYTTTSPRLHRRLGVAMPDQVSKPR